MSDPSPPPAERVTLAFVGRNRLDLTRRTLPTLDVDGASLLVLDDSDQPEAVEWLRGFRPRAARLVAREPTPARGAAEALRYALWKLTLTGEDPWRGFVENDMLLGPGWWPACRRAVAAAEAAGYRVGAVTPLCPHARSLVIRPGFAVQWVVGQAVVLRSELVGRVLRDFEHAVTLRSVRSWARGLGHDLDRNPYFAWNRRQVGLDIGLQHDWAIVPSLLAAGYVSVAPVPGAAHDLDRPHSDFGTRDVVLPDDLRPVAPPLPPAALTRTAPALGPKRNVTRVRESAQLWGLRRLPRVPTRRAASGAGR